MNTLANLTMPLVAHLTRPTMIVLLPDGWGSAVWQYAELPLAVAFCSLMGYPPGMPANDPEL